MNTDTTIPTTPVATRVATTAPGVPTRPQRNAERRDFGEVTRTLFNDDLPPPILLRRTRAIRHGDIVTPDRVPGAPARLQRHAINIQYQPGANNVVRHLFDDDVPTDDEGEQRDDS